MRTLKINSEKWLWKRGRYNIVIRQEGTNTKYVVPSDQIGEVFACSCSLGCNCYDTKVAVTPKHIRTYIESQRKPNV